MNYPDTLSRLEDKVRQLEEARMQEARERDHLRARAENKNAALNEAMAEVGRLRSVLTGIAEYCSGDDRSLGAVVRLASVHNTARQALRAPAPQS